MQELGSSTAEIAAAVREITQTSKELSGTMSDVNGRANEAASLAASGRSRLAGMEGTSTEIQIHVKEFLKTKKKLNEILMKHTGRTLDAIEKDTDRDNFMSANEAREFGLIDKVLERMPVEQLGAGHRPAAE